MFVGLLYRSVVPLVFSLLLLLKCTIDRQPINLSPFSCMFTFHRCMITIGAPLRYRGHTKSCIHILISRAHTHACQFYRFCNNFAGKYWCMRQMGLSSATLTHTTSLISHISLFLSTSAIVAAAAANAVFINRRPSLPIIHCAH